MVRGRRPGSIVPQRCRCQTDGVGRGTGTVQLDTGILGTGAFGRSFGNVRVEGELVYNANNILVKIGHKESFAYAEQRA